MKPFNSVSLIKRMTALTALGFIAILSTGCGNIGASTRNSANAYGVNLEQAELSGGTSEVGDYSCPAAANVKPDYDWKFDGTGSFTVCPGKTSTYKIWIEGIISGTEKVCVFPIQFVDATRFVWKLNAVGKPMFNCDVTPSWSGTEVNFDLTQYNAVMIVPSADQAKMSSCLINHTNCPVYAQGRFR
ncbi:MAG: hypothetical protein H7222_01950 [Methylotenera sp.]|nr:hypothetical protein [Oligoflexia bacterium]